MSSVLEHAQTLMLAALRCVGCGRSPTVDELTAMREDFGRKLRADDGPRLVWRCLSCARKGAPLVSAVLEPLRKLPAELLDEPCAVCGHPGGLHWQPYGGCCVIEECKCNAFVKGATSEAIATLEHDARTPVMVAFCPLCGVPWPAIGEKLCEHQRCAVPGNTRELTPCEGSGLVLPREAFRPNGDPRFAPPEPRP